MRIGIDASRIRLEATGTEHVSSLLVRNLLELPEASAHEFVLYAQHDLPTALYQTRENVMFHRVRSGRPWLWKFSRAVKQDLDSLDVLFVPSHIVPSVLPTRVVTMVHGLEWFRVPGAYSAWEQQVQFFATRRAVQTCDTILVPSEVTQSDLLEWSESIKISPRAIEVVPHGPVPLPREVSAPENQLLSEVADTPFFVFVGRHDLRKNLPVLLRAFAEHVQDASVRLVLAGGEGNGTKQLQHVLQAQGMQDRVILPGYVSDNDKAWLLQQAVALVYPSFAEGFGLPLLEAFEAKCPVVASDIAIHHEVAGEAALFADPNEASEWGAVLNRLLERPQDRETLIQQGASRLEQFSWSASAEKTLRVLIG